ncbi:hypothetical protein MA16_Dca015762 [Dendrobium catenatum]|uniref:Uncharacterized protein n=1 Tax=Dendrobium catenatum TaxID=906689 RepID=A0A2I0VQN4_9ASPA|nr:hypothetical protein MA16_Dca015762 [Dendrobium catenatum]
MTMEGRRSAPSEAWAIIRRGFNAPVRSSLEVFKGSQILASGFNSFPKQKPLIIREGALLKKVVNPVPVGKGKEAVIVDDFLSPRKSVPSTCCKVSSIITNEDVSSSSRKTGIKSISLPSSPNVIISGKKTEQEVIKSNEDKVLDVFPPLISINMENKKKFVDALNVPLEGHIETAAAWKKKQNIRVDNLDIGSFLSNDGNSVKLHSENEINNTKRLRNALDSHKNLEEAIMGVCDVRRVDIFDSSYGLVSLSGDSSLADLVVKPINVDVANLPFLNAPISLISNDALLAQLELNAKDTGVDQYYWLDGFISSSCGSDGDELDEPIDEMYGLNVGCIIHKAFSYSGGKRQGRISLKK